VIAPAGTLDAETSPAFADFVDESLRARPLTEAVILDLTEVALLTHGGLYAVRCARRHVERHGIRVVIVAEPGSPVARAFSGSTTRVYDTRREAISAVRPST
jgi:anti-anti-sigma factor